MDKVFFGMRVGILGGGQLAQMLASSAERMGLTPVPFCSNAADPAAQICAEKVIGSISDRDSLQKFFSQIDLVTYENDFLPYDLLREFEAAGKFSFRPPLSVLELVRDK